MMMLRKTQLRIDGVLAPFSKRFAPHLQCWCFLPSSLFSSSLVFPLFHPPPPLFFLPSTPLISSSFSPFFFFSTFSSPPQCSKEWVASDLELDQLIPTHHAFQRLSAGFTYFTTFASPQLHHFKYSPLPLTPLELPLSSTHLYHTTPTTPHHITPHQHRPPETRVDNHDQHAFHLIFLPAALEDSTVFSRFERALLLWSS